MIAPGRSLSDHLVGELQLLGAGSDRLLLAVSGGPDSVALLHALARSDRHRHLTVAHIDHGIHPSSGAVAAAVTRLARELDVPIVARELALRADASEGTARDARYAALEALRLEAGAAWIVTAHHADDQAETVLLRLLHGSGPAGLAAMAPLRGRIVRPLLGVRRSELAAYVEAHGLQAWADPANTDSRHDRAWIRTTLMPVIADRVADTPGVLQRVALQAAADRTAWDRLLDAWPSLEFRAIDGGASLAAGPLVAVDPVLAAALVRAVARRAGCQLGEHHAARLVGWLRSAPQGGSFTLPAGWSGVLHRDRLSLEKATEPVAVPECIIHGVSGSVDWAGWRLDWRRDEPGLVTRESSSSWFPAGPLILRGSRPGDAVVPFGGVGRRRVVRCLQDAGIQPDRRPNWPVLVSGEDVVWVLGVCRGAGATAKPGEEALRVDVTQS